MSLLDFKVTHISLGRVFHHTTSVINYLITILFGTKYQRGQTIIKSILKSSFDHGSGNWRALPRHHHIRSKHASVPKILVKI